MRSEAGDAAAARSTTSRATGGLSVTTRALPELVAVGEGVALADAVKDAVVDLEASAPGCQEPGGGSKGETQGDEGPKIVTGGAHSPGGGPSRKSLLIMLLIGAAPVSDGSAAGGIRGVAAASGCKIGVGVAVADAGGAAAGVVSLGPSGPAPPGSCAPPGGCCP